MKTFKKVQKTVSYLDEHKCDLCGDDIKRSSAYCVDVKCVKRAYEGDELEREEFDVCPDCWEDKIVPLFAEAFGVKPSVKD